jgi:hypothetical protein
MQRRNLGRMINVEMKKSKTRKNWKREVKRLMRKLGRRNRGKP